jgi:hypothetical protein
VDGAGIGSYYGSEVTVVLSEEGPATLYASAKVEATPLSDDGLMLVDLESGGCWQLNRVGREVWELFRNGSSVDAVVESLASSYGVERERLLADLMSVVDPLREQGLLLPTKPP